MLDCYCLRQINKLLGTGYDLLNLNDVFVTLLHGCIMALFLFHPAVYRTEEILNNIKGLNDDIEELKGFLKQSSDISERNRYMIDSLESRLKICYDSLERTCKKAKELMIKLSELQKSHEELSILFKEIQTAKRVFGERVENIMREHTAKLSELQESQKEMKHLSKINEDKVALLESCVKNVEGMDEKLRKDVANI